MSTLPRLNSYKLFYEQIPLPDVKVAQTKRPGRKSYRLSDNVLDNL